MLRTTKPSGELTPPMITIIGSPGVGKTSLGGLFPRPIIMRAEDGTAVFQSWDPERQPDLLPVLPRAYSGSSVSTRSTVIQTIDALISQEHQFQTLVIDSITALAALYEQEITVKYDKSNIADAAGGYGKGYLEAISWHSELLNRLLILNKQRKMGVVLLAHTDTEKVKEDPESGGEYTVYGLQMEKRAGNQYVNTSDVVAYLVNRTVTMGHTVDKKGNTEKRGRVQTTGERSLLTSGDGRFGFIKAKNRLRLPAEIPVADGENPLLGLIPYYAQQQQAAQFAQQPAQAVQTAQPTQQQMHMEVQS